MLPVLVVGFSLSFSGSGSEQLEGGTSLVDNTNFQSSCLGPADENGKIYVIDTPKCQWKAATVTGPCLPMSKDKFKDATKFKEIPIEGLPCLQKSKDDKCPDKSGVEQQKPGGCSPYVDESGSLIGNFYVWQDTPPFSQNPVVTIDSVDNNWIAEGAVGSEATVGFILTTPTCQHVCETRVPIGDQLTASAREYFGSGTIKSCKCTFQTASDIRMVPCDICEGSQVSHDKPNFNAALGGSLGGLAVALGYIVILSR